MNQEQLKTRLRNFAISIIYLCRKLPENREGRLLGNQIFRSGTSIAANYRAVCRARSKADFIAKLGIVEEEADETLFWLGILKDIKIIENKDLDSLIAENNEILSIIVASRKTAKNNLQQQVK